VASELENACGDIVYNACGKYSLLQSAAIVSQSKMIITNDTGMMHIASSYNRNIISVWGNTVPAFGMTPYMPENYSNSKIVEAKNVNCRPCSKIGFAKCPKGHE
jgi:ADP-heptose:LPS heptosyltransferase